MLQQTQERLLLLVADLNWNVLIMNSAITCLHRSWDKLYVVLRGNLLMFYKDQKSYKAAPEVYFKGESPVDLRGGSTKVADDYTKKKHVFRIK